MRVSLIFDELYLYDKLVLYVYFSPERAYTCIYVERVAWASLLCLSLLDPLPLGGEAELLPVVPVPLRYLLERHTQLCRYLNLLVIVPKWIDLE